MKKMSSKALLSIMGILVIVIAVTVGITMSKNNAAKSMEQAEMEEPTVINIEQTLEYGEDIADKTFTVHTKEEEKEVNFTELNPEVDTMKVGKTEHKLQLDEETYDVIITVEDTQKPVIKGVKETIKLEGEEVDVEAELKKMITAEDPVDGELEVTFIIEEKEDKENEYNVTAEAIDNNDNKTTEKFEVIVKIEEKEKEAKKSNEDSKSTASKSNESSSNNKSNATSSEKKSSNSSSNKSSSSSSSSNKSSSSSSSNKSETKAPSKPKQEKPKQEKPKQEKPKQEKPKDNSGSNNSGTGVVGGNNALPEYPPLNNPSGLPSGAKLISNESPTGHVYSYSRSLPGGGEITEVSAISVDEPIVMIKGKDNDGNNFMSQYAPVRNILEHYLFVSLPKFTDDDILILYEVGREFGEAYKMN
jgi:hypothetical protein